MRDYWAQTDASGKADGHAQTEPIDLKPKKKGGRGAKMAFLDGPNPKGAKGQPQSGKAVFADREAMMQKARQALIRPQYNVFDYYHDEGMVQEIARGWVFENLTFAVILFNAIWIAIDTDFNNADVILDAEAIFIIAENFFCVFFLAELSIRFCAFRHKIHILQDMWFIFDSGLVSMMVIETWIVPIILIVSKAGSGAGVGNLSLLRMIKMVKMMRLSRMARVLRAVPELVILMKGLGAAARSVAVFFLFWLILIYVFAILFRGITDGSAVGDKYFSSVPTAMNTLLLDGILPDNSIIVNDLAQAHPFFWLIIMFFIALASITLMYMLIGVLVDVVTVIACTEKEGMTVSSVAYSLREVMCDIGRDPDDRLTKSAFQDMLVQPGVAQILQEVGVDVVVLVDMSDVLYEDLDKDGMGLTFEQFIEVVLNMRGTNPATVKDCKEQLRIIKSIVKSNGDVVMKNISEEVDALSSQIRQMNELQFKARRRDDSDEESDSKEAAPELD